MTEAVAGFEFRGAPGAVVVRSGAVRAVFTRRDGPVSGRVGGTNLSQLAGDDPDDVARARRWAAGLTDLDAGQVTWGFQVHGAHAAYVDAAAMLESGAEPLPATDALVTDVPRLGLGVLVADCIPVLLAASDCVGVVHVGWRGLVAGVVGSTLALMRGRTGEEIRAVLGPSIGVCCYEVGPDVAREFHGRWPDRVVEWAGGRTHVDLRGAAAAALRASGVEAVVPMFPCTFCDQSSLFSHRAGDAGRQALVAGLAG